MPNNNLKLLIQENNSLCRQLSAPHQKLLRRLLKYMGFYKINSLERELMRKDLIGMALESEMRGQPLSETIASEKEFCDSILENSPQTDRTEYRILFCKKILELLSLAAVTYAFILPALGASGTIEISPLILAVLAGLTVMIPLAELRLEPRIVFMTPAGKWGILASTNLMRFVYFLIINLNALLLGQPVFRIHIRLPFVLLSLIFLALWAALTMVYNNYLRKLSADLIL